MAGQLEEKEAAKLAGLKEKREELVRMMAELEVSGGQGIQRWWVAGLEGFGVVLLLPLDGSQQWACARLLYQLPLLLLFGWVHHFTCNSDHHLEHPACCSAQEHLSPTCGIATAVLNSALLRTSTPSRAPGVQEDGGGGQGC